MLVCAEGAWVGCKLRGQGRELAFNRLCKHLDSFDTLRWDFVAGCGVGGGVAFDWVVLG